MAVQVRELYAQALFDAADPGERKAFLPELQALEKLFSENPEYPRLMDSPSLEKAKRRELLSEAFSGQVDAKVLNFLKVLADNGRFSAFPAIVGEYGQILDRAAGVLAVTAVTAAPLSEEMTERLKAKLAAQTGRTIRLEVRVDPSVLGGILLQYEGKEIDGTVRAKLSALRSQISDAAV